MKDRKLAVRYARALLASFPDPYQAEAVDQFLTGLGEAIEEMPRVKAMLLDPSYSRSVRTSMLRGLVDRAGLPAKLGNFLEALVENNRAASLASIAAVYREMRESAIGIVPAEIATAQPLPEELEQRARAAVEQMTGRTVRLTCRVDPGLIGGAVTRIGSTVYDGSLRSQLAMLRRKMTEE